MTKEEIMQKTDFGLKVYEFYCPGIKLKKKIRSLLREEKDPSFNIFVNKNSSEIWFKDFAGGMELTGNALKFVQLKESTDYFGAKDFISDRILGELGNYYPDRKNSYSVLSEIRNEKHKRPLVITPIAKDWSQSELAWWAKFGIGEDTLERFFVCSVSKYYMETSEKIIEINASTYNPIYSIGINGRYKIYRPMDKTGKFKWRSNTIGEKDIFGWHLLGSPPLGEKFRICFIMAGNKDVMSFHALTGLPAIALNSETANIPFEYKAELDVIFEKVVILYDNDKTGKEAAIKLNEHTGYPIANHLLDIALGVKDFAEMVEKKPEYLPEFMESIRSIILENISV